MKGLLKLSTVALSAAMVAGMSTPVFAAGANVGGTTKSTTIEVKDANGNVVATTKSGDGVKVFDFDGNGLADSTLDNTGDHANALNVVNVRMTNGDVKALTATASDSSTVKWNYDTDNLPAGKTTDDVKKAVTVDNGTITVTKDAEAGTYRLLAYIDSNIKKDATNGELTEGNWVTVNVVVSAPSFDKVEYVNADSTYTTQDNLSVSTLVGLDGSSDETKLPKAATHSTKEFKDYALKTVNHVALGESAAFTAKLADDDADYNTLLDYTYAVKNGSKDYDFSKSLKATTDANANSGKVSVTGTVTGNGLEAFNVVLSGKAGTASKTLYVIADASEAKNVYRVYNPNSGEHFYTVSAEEADALDKIGWELESVGWVAPSKGDDVYRLYNPNSGEHHYTTSAKERNALKAAGWNYEGVAFYSASKSYSPIYREYNKNAEAFNHNYTADANENKYLMWAGWKYEGVAFYALSDGASLNVTEEVAKALKK